MSPSGQTAAAGPTTDVPEFHDCQAFVVKDGGGLHFLSLFAIFARYQIDAYRQLDILRANPSSKSVFVAEVFSYDARYPALGIEKGFNCLYLRRGATGQLIAIMTQVKRSDRECLATNTPNGVELAVNEVRMPNASFDDYPPVARWDWDSERSQQYIGVKCGTAWCEIHERNPAFRASRLYTRSNKPPEGRVAAIKGWYDEQLLAVPAANGLAVGSLRGTVVPEPDLGQWSGASGALHFRYHWRKVATVALVEDSALRTAPGVVRSQMDVYAKKLSLHPSAMPNPTTALFLCYSPAGSVNQCFPNKGDRPLCAAPTSPNEWYAMSVSPGQKPVYRCVIRRDHPGVKIPGIVRWRWQATDDTYWIRCLNGCCEVKPGA